MPGEALLYPVTQVTFRQVHGKRAEHRAGGVALCPDSPCGVATVKVLIFFIKQAFHLVEVDVPVDNLQALAQRVQDGHDRKKLDVLAVFDIADCRGTDAALVSYPLLGAAQRLALGSYGCA